jgi:hypothetical protein
MGGGGGKRERVRLPERRQGASDEEEEEMGEAAEAREAVVEVEVRTGVKQSQKGPPMVPTHFPHTPLRAHPTHHYALTPQMLSRLCREREGEGVREGRREGGREAARERGREGGREGGRLLSR